MTSTEFRYLLQNSNKIQHLQVSGCRDTYCETRCSGGINLFLDIWATILFRTIFSIMSIGAGAIPMHMQQSLLRFHRVRGIQCEAIAGTDCFNTVVTSFYASDTGCMIIEQMLPFFTACGSDVHVTCSLRRLIVIWLSIWSGSFGCVFCSWAFSWTILISRLTTLLRTRSVITFLLVVMGQKWAEKFRRFIPPIGFNAGAKRIEPCFGELWRTRKECKRETTLSRDTEARLSNFDRVLRESFSVLLVFAESRNSEDVPKTSCVGVQKSKGTSKRRLVKGDRYGRNQ